MKASQINFGEMNKNMKKCHFLLWLDSQVMIKYSAQYICHILPGEIIRNTVHIQTSQFLVVKIFPFLISLRKCRDRGIVMDTKKEKRIRCLYSE